MVRPSSVNSTFHVFDTAYLFFGQNKSERFVKYMNK